MKIGVVVLVRLSSSRLPGKALIKINNKPVIIHIIDSISKVIPKNQIVVATSTDLTDDPLCNLLVAENISFYRGSLDNVASRFYEASSKYGFEYSIRINGDNIFLDTKLLNKVISQINTRKFNFISNVKDRTYPKGMSIEAVSLSYYQSHLQRILMDNYHKEHVMSWIYTLDSSLHLYLYNQECPQAAGIQLALDTPTDLERTKKIMNEMDKPIWKYTTCEVLSITKKLKL